MSETTEASATEPTETPNAAPAEGVQTTETQAAPEQQEAAPAAPEAPPKEDWREQRIRALTAKHAAEAERARQLEERLEALTRAQAQPAQPNATPAQAPAAAPQNDMEARVAAEVERREMQKAADRTYQIGREKFPDFDMAAQGYELAGGVTPPFAKAILALEHPADVFYALGKDPREAMRVMALPPERQAYELARMEAKLTAPPAPRPVSRAPSPISPIATGHDVDENAEPDPAENPKAYMAWVAKRVARR